MSVSTETVKQIYDANGVTDTFAVPFAFIEDEGGGVVKVYELDDTTGEATLKTNPTHYTLDDDDNPTNVEYVAPPADGKKILVIRESDVEQNLEYEDGVPFPAKTHENQLDRLVLMIQEVKEKADRALKLNFLNSDIESNMRKLSTPGALLQLNDEGDAIEEGPTYQEILDAKEAAQEAATNAQSSATAAEGSATAAANSATAADNSADDAEAAQTAAEAAQAAAEAAQAAAEAAASTAASNEVVRGDSGAPEDVDVTGVTAPINTTDTVVYVQGDGGAIDIAANPQIGAGSRDGQRLTLVGCSNVNTLKLEHGTGLVLNGECTLQQYSELQLRWDAVGAIWRECGRNGL